MSEELAKRAVACPGWRWMPGMLPLVVDEDGDCVTCDRVWRTQGGHTVVPAGAFPDLNDPATLGCLLALVREAWADGGLITRRKVRRSGVSWWVVFYDADQGRMRSTREQPTEAEALVAALEAAP